MKIAFYPQNCVPYHARTLEERPLGGTETGIIRLAAALHKLGHEVTVFTPMENPPPSEPKYVHISAARTMSPVDVFVIIREWMPVLARIPSKKIFLWTGDGPEQVHNFGIGDRRVAQRIDCLLQVSNWQADVMARASGFPREKMYVIRNGVHAPYFEGTEPRSRKRLIYSSTPYRGLRFLPIIFQELIKKHADAELHVFSGMDVYKSERGHDGSLSPADQAVFDQLRKIPNVTLHGNVLQKDLAREFMRSTILAYPNAGFAETSCITALEAIAAGCVPVTSVQGALPETVGKCGVFINEQPGSKEYLQKYLAVVDKLLSDDALLGQLSKACAERAPQLSWDKVATDFVEYLRLVHGIA